MISTLTARLGAGFVGACVARAAADRLIPSDASKGDPRWSRLNHRGEPVTLLEGPVLVAGATAGLLVVPGLPLRSRVAALTAMSVAAAVGAYDDRSIDEGPASKGFRGHLGALRAGHVTSGTVKVVGIGAAGLAAGAMLRPARAGPVERIAAGLVIAASANLINLLDLRPGRALKAGLLGGGHLAVRAGRGGPVVAGGLGAAAALLSRDLDEQAMLGDCGANALGALLGAGVAAQSSPRFLYAVLAGLAVATVASERFSFTDVIDATPGLRELDRLGRRPT